MINDRMRFSHGCRHIHGLGRKFSDSSGDSSTSRSKGASGYDATVVDFKSSFYLVSFLLFFWDFKLSMDFLVFGTPLGYPRTSTVALLLRLLWLEMNVMIVRSLLSASPLLIGMVTQALFFS
jgi:hypothetical protein